MKKFKWLGILGLIIVLTVSIGISSVCAFKGSWQSSEAEITLPSQAVNLHKFLERVVEIEEIPEASYMYLYGKYRVSLDPSIPQSGISLKIKPTGVSLRRMGSNMYRVEIFYGFLESFYKNIEHVVPRQNIKFGTKKVEVKVIVRIVKYFKDDKEALVFQRKVESAILTDREIMIKDTSRRWNSSFYFKKEDLVNWGSTYQLNRELRIDFEAGSISVVSEEEK